MPDCLFRDPPAGDQQPLNRQEMWAATQYKPNDGVRVPPPLFCNELEDAPKQPPTARVQPKEKARPKHVPPSARPSPPPKPPQKDSWADATDQEESPRRALPRRPRLSLPPRALKSRKRSLHHSSTSYLRSRNPSCLRTPIPPPKRPPPSLLRHHSQPRDHQGPQANLDPPAMENPTSPQPTRPQSTSLFRDRISTWIPSAI